METQGVIKLTCDVFLPCDSTIIYLNQCASSSVVAKNKRAYYINPLRLDEILCVTAIVHRNSFPNLTKICSLKLVN